MREEHQTPPLSLTKCCLENNEEFYFVLSKVSDNTVWLQHSITFQWCHCSHMGRDTTARCWHLKHAQTNILTEQIKPHRINSEVLLSKSLREHYCSHNPITLQVFPGSLSHKVCRSKDQYDDVGVVRVNRWEHTVQKSPQSKSIMLHRHYPVTVLV